MNFELDEQQMAIRDAVQKICARFGDDYWLERDTDGEFPEAFVKAVTDGG
ncbi:MAG TPA: acyl-CoA dehydrogenase, partial [Gammaproteobacteria bacterium]|nr:acyl-CoA dehydrogenase [Gammaproteobacteria bacterium]